jgi:hypothetical protein
MKKTTILAKSLVVFVGGIFMATAQSTANKPIKVQKRTLMDKFEPDLVKPVDERIALKEKRIASQQQTKKILDTLDISDRKRRRLMRELRRSPFSERIQKTILAETEFEDEIDNNPKK